MKLHQVLLIGLAMLLLAQGIPAQERSDANLPCLFYGPDGRVLPVSKGACFQMQEGPWVPSPEPATDDITLVQIGTAPGPMYNTLSGGDSDGDGLFEVYEYIGVGGTFTYRGFENNGSNTYTQVFQNTAGLIPYAYGEVDGDNLPDVIGQWSSWVYVYESPALGQYANTQVWQSPTMPNVTGYTAIGDLDQDGHMEIIHSWNSFGSDNRLVIFENTGNNQFQEIYNQPIATSNTGQKAIGDFDGDGHMELALTSGAGDVFVYESTGDNTFTQTYHGTMGASNAYACVYANDMDNNGRPEFICGGSSFSQGWYTQVYEATGNNTYAVRQTITINDNYVGIPGLCAGDLDGDGKDEFVIQTAQALHVFKWNTSSQTYTEVQTVPENFGPILHGIFSYESNNNGNDDVFWTGIDYNNNTIVLENQSGTQPSLSVVVQPVAPPITVPAAGGSFNFNATVQRVQAPQAPFYVWSRDRFPDGSYTANLLGPVQINPPVGQQVTRLRTQNVPGTWPAGIHWYIGYANPTVAYPAADADSFAWTKLTTGAEGPFVWDAACTGELFEGETVPQQAVGHLAAFSLVSASPNPFNPTTTIRYQLQAASQVSLKVYDTAGRLVATLVEGMQEAGTHSATFDGSKLASGMYFVKMQAGNYTAVQKLMLLK